MAGIVEEVTAADDRRHGEAHFSEFISLNEMIEKTKEVCPDFKQFGTLAVCAS